MPASLRQRVIRVAVILIAANLGAWAWTLTALAGRPMLLGTALLAYGLGLRHAVDADHIAAIDNVTRRLMQQGQRPVAVGLFFALGHSTVVIAAAVAVASASAALHGALEAYRPLGAAIGSAVSALFLLAIAMVNLAVLLDVWRSLRRIRRGVPAPATVALPGGVLARLCRPLFAVMSRSWHMYPLGLLFGLGFDTATEVTLLALSAQQAADGLPLAALLVFPVLFTAGMSLIDTADGVLMLGAYGWAMVDPVRRLRYNLVITSTSVVVAVLIGGIEALGLMGDRMGLTGGLWDLVGTVNDNLSRTGAVIVGLFAASWLASALVLRRRRRPVEARCG